MLPHMTIRLDEFDAATTSKRRVNFPNNCRQHTIPRCFDAPGRSDPFARLLVHSGVYDAFVSQLVEKVKNITNSEGVWLSNHLEYGLVTCMWTQNLSRTL
jgi:hypothetical protein